MTKSNVNPNHYKVAGRARQGEDIAQVRNKQKHAESLVAARMGPHARFPKTTAVARAAQTSTKTAKGTATKTPTKTATKGVTTTTTAAPVKTRKTAAKKARTPDRQG